MTINSKNFSKVTPRCTWMDLALFNSILKGRTSLSSGDVVGKLCRFYQHAIDLDFYVPPDPRFEYFVDEVQVGCSYIP